MNWKAVRTSALLSLLFLLVYGGCNWFTSTRHDIGSFYFAWERHIPFVPLMIVPYMSIDLFFIAAPFLCRGDRQRRTFSNRVIAAILVAGVCFLLMPLRFSFERPPAEGWLGVVFNNFRSLDQPYNQFPSLHIALRTILATLYVHRTRGILRLLVRVWFSLIGLSTLLTYQHHLIDVIGGFALGCLCLHLFQDQPLRLPVICNRRVGLYYAAGSLLLIALAFTFRPWTYLLLWPALSLALLTAAYFGLGPGIYRKHDGRLPLLTWLLLWPVLLGQRLSLLHYARRCRPWDVLTPHLWIGRKLSTAQARDAVARGVTAVLDLAGEFSEAEPFRAIAYHQLPILDLTGPTQAQLDEAVAFIRDQSARGIVYVHCKVGYSRTAAVAGAYLLAGGLASSVAEASAMLRAARGGIVLRPEVIRAVQEYDERAAVTPARC